MITQDQLTDHAYLEFTGCLSYGDAGAPLFAWFSEGPCVGACLVGVISGEYYETVYELGCGNFASGEADMVNLIAGMRADYP